MNSENSKVFLVWNRNVLNFYWVLSGFIIWLGQITYYLSDRTSSWMFGGYVHPNIVTISIALIAILVLSEIMIRLILHLFDYVLICIGFIIAIITMLVIGDNVNGIQIILEIPILVSMFYFSSKRLWFATLITCIGFMLVYALVDELRQRILLYDLIVLLAMISGTVVIGYAIRRRGIELLYSLERAVTVGKELFVDTITLEYTAKQDHLTGLYNHITFHEYLNTIIQQHETNGLKLQLAILDIDNFKEINDTYGHLMGDEVLRRISEILTDAISAEDFVARYGGEEFTLIMTGRTQEKSLQLIEDIRTRISTAIFPGVKSLIVTVSIGLAEYESGLGKDAFFRKADALLYQAKLQGKNRTMSDVGKELADEQKA